MRARVSVVVLVLIAVAVVGLILQLVAKARHDDSRVRCLNNLRLHGQVAIALVEFRGQAPKPARDGEIPGAVPAGTVFVEGRKPEDRLSWIADGLPVMEQSLQPTPALATLLEVDRDRLPRVLSVLRQPTGDLAAGLDRTATWDAGRNAEIGLTRLKLFTCPANIPALADGVPAVTQYVGLAGVGLDAATIPLVLVPAAKGPPLLAPASPRAGCFRYDAPTPFDVIYRHDGLDTTLLFAEVSADLGPWMRGGPATVRGVDDSPAAKPHLGFDGQFGGNHQGGGAAVSYVSGSARFLTPRIHPAVFRAMTTIAGGEADGIPGE